MITKQEYIDLKNRRAEISYKLRCIKRAIKLITKYKSISDEEVISKLFKESQALKQELKWLDILLRDTKQQLRERFRPKYEPPKEFKLE